MSASSWHNTIEQLFVRLLSESYVDLPRPDLFLVDGSIEITPGEATVIEELLTKADQLAEAR